MVMGGVGARVDAGKDGTLQASAFKAEVTGEYGDGLGRMGDRGFAWQVGHNAGICISGAFAHMASSADHMVNYRECNLKLRIADGTTRSIEGYGDINFAFWFGNGLVDVMMTNVTHVPDFRYHLFSLLVLIKNVQAFATMLLERSVVFALSGTLFRLYGYRVDSRRRVYACAVRAAGKPQNKFAISINDFHCAAGQPHEVLL